MPTTADPDSAPSINPAARWVATSGPGTSARPSASKTTAASAMPRPTPPAASARHRPNTPASPELPPAGPVDHSVGFLAGPQPLEGELPLAQAADPLGQLGLELGELEVHRGRLARRRWGRPDLGCGLLG